jgi:hypothetical protein
MKLFHVFSHFLVEDQPLSPPRDRAIAVPHYSRNYDYAVAQDRNAKRVSIGLQLCCHTAPIGFRLAVTLRIET